MDFSAFLIDNDDFKIWSTEHYAWLAFGVVSTAFWLFLGKKQPNLAQKSRVGLAMSLVGVVAWLYFLVVILATGKWDWQNVLPLHMCYFLNFVLPFMHSRRSFLLFEITFFWIVAACTQALFTPDLNTAAPAYFAVKYWFVHIGLVQSAIFGAVIYGFRPRWQGIFWALAAGNLLLVFDHAVNLLIGTNFMYSMKKPPGSMLDLLGEHYLLWAEGLALGMFFLIWVVFAFFGKKGRAGAERV